MSIRSKRLGIATLAVVGIYAFTPFVAGLIGTYDRRGPKIFVEDHHEILYRIGYSMAGRGKPRVPFMQDRSWFYGIPGERTPERQVREKLQSLSQQR